MIFEIVPAIYHSLFINTIHLLVNCDMLNTDTCV